MEFTCQVTIDDLLKSGEHAHRTTSRVKGVAVAWGVCAVLCLARAHLHWSGGVALVDWRMGLLALLGVCNIVLLPRWYERDSLKETYRQCLANVDDQETGALKLVISDESLTKISERGITTLLWKDVASVEAVADSVYLYPSGLPAIIIPSHSFAGERSFDDFTAELVKRMYQARSSPLACESSAHTQPPVARLRFALRR